MEKISVILAGCGEEEYALLEEYLSGRGDFAVLCTLHDGRAALEAIAERKPQAVVMDLVLPGLDGLGLLEAVMALDRPPKVLILSQWLREEVIREALYCGASYFMAKPCDPDSLARRLYMAVRGMPSGTFPAAEAARSERTVRLLRALGLAAAQRGTELARRAILLAVEDPSSLRAGKTRLCAPLAAGCGGTADGVEHALRYAVARAWTEGDAEFQRALFGSTVYRKSGKPTNAEFLAVTADWVRREEEKLRHYA